MSAPMIDKVSIRSNGQMTIPKEARERLGVAEGSQVTLIYEDDRVIMMNPNIYALKTLQRAMEGQAEKLGLTTEEAINRLCREIRAEVEGL